MKFFYPLLILLLGAAPLSAQVGIGTTTPNSNAVLELKSPGNNQGFLVPRLTSAQRAALALSTAENGLLVFDSDENRFYYWHASQWLPIRSGDDVALQAGAGIDITAGTISVIPDGDGDASNEIQDLELTGTDLKITNNASATTIDLSPFNDADGSVTNEIQDLQLVGNTLTITNNAAATPIDLAPFSGTNTDNQTLSFNATTGVLGITGGNTVTVTPTGTAGGILSGTYPNPGLSTGAGNSIAGVLNNASTTTPIQANKLESTVVLQSESPTGGVISGSFGGGLQISDNAVTTAKILNSAVTTAKVADLAVTNAKVADAAITGVKIADATIGSAKLTTTGVTASTYGTATAVPQFAVDAQGRITAVTPVNIAGVAPGGAATGDLAGTYPGPTIAAAAGNNIVSAINNTSTSGLVASSRLAADVVLDSENLPAASQVSGNFTGGFALRDNVVSTTKLQDGAVTTAKIAPSAVPGEVLTTVAGVAAWASLPAATGGTVTSITAGTGLESTTITSSGTINVAANGITATLLRSDAATDANRAVTNTHIRDGAVTDAKLSTTGVAANTYGSATQIPVFTVNNRGRITSASNVAVSGGTTEGLAETLAADSDAKSLPAVNLSAVSINTTSTLGALNVNGSHYVSFTMFDDGYIVAKEDYILVSNPGKPASIELPKAAESRGRILIIRSQATSINEAVTVNAPDGLDGFPTSEPLYMESNISSNVAYSITVMSTGTTWITISRSLHFDSTKRG